MSRKSLRQQRSHRLDSRYVEHAIGFFLTEVSLECRDGIACVAVKVAGRRHRIAISAEHVLKLLDGRIGLPQHIEGSIRDDRMRLDPKAKSGPVQAGPRKLLARVALARGGDIRMSQDAFGRDAITGQNPTAERRDGRDLALWKIRIAIVVARIDDFNADRARVDVGFALPTRLAG